jgi:putative transposase
MIERHPVLSVRRQCELLGLDRSGLYYAPAPIAPEEIALCHRLDELYTQRPHYGVRSMTTVLRREGHTINPKRVRRLLRQMGILAVYPKPRLSLPGAGAQVFPYLLRGLPILRPHQVWAIDITYVRLRGGFCYLVALLDWFSRFVLAWELCGGLETFYCLRVLEAARASAGCTAEIVNSDQGSQFTSMEWIAAVQALDMQVSHDGRGRALDNVIVERFWRTVKYDDIYLRDYQSVPEARGGLGDYIAFYNWERPHQSLEDRTPGEVMKGTHKRTGGSRQRLLLARAVPSGSVLRRETVRKR